MLYGEGEGEGVGEKRDEGGYLKFVFFVFCNSIFKSYKIYSTRFVKW